MLLNALASLGHKGIKTLRTFGRAGLMLFNALVGKPEFRKHAPLLVRQLYNVGVLSMLIIVVSGVFIGMVLGLQGYLVLTTYSAEPPGCSRGRALVWVARFTRVMGVPL